MAIEGKEVAATMKDIKELETSLTSAMNARMDEMREMIADLIKAQTTTPSASPTPEESPSGKKPEEKGEEEGESGTKDDPPKKNATPQGKGEKEDYHQAPLGSWYSPDPPIPHPHINHRGDPPKIDASTSFTQWQYLMKTHLNSSCIKLWRVIQNGFKPVDPNNPIRREVVDHQLDSTALHILQQAVGEKELSHIQQFSTRSEERRVGKEC